MTATHDATQAASGAAKAAPSISQRRRRSMLGNAWRGFVKAPFNAKFGMVIIALYVIAAIFAPIIAPYGEAAVVGKGYQPWSWQYLMGTDQLGRDLFSRLIYGARNTVGVALLTTLLSFALGGGLGLLAAIAKGWIDQILSRIVDALMAIPVLILAEHRRHGLCRGGAPARREAALDHAARDPAQHHGAAGGGVRPQVLLRVPDHRQPLLPRPRPAAADRRLGLDGL
jgi:hypothetical protein